MNGTYQTTMGDRGRLVVPAALRASAGLDSGVPLTLVDTPRGIVVLTRQQLRDWVRADLAGLDLVGDLLADRRAEVAHDSSPDAA